MDRASAADLSATWPAGPPRPVLAGDEVHVWRAELDAPGWPDSARLPAPERERAERMLSPASSRRWVASRWALRTVLARYLATEPEAIALRSDTRGKPELAESADRLAFNLSHSGGLALIAVAAGRQVGVDVERVDAGRDLVALADRALDPEASAEVREAPAGPERAAAFHDAWARREALVKCFGGGLGEPPPTAPAALLRLEPGPGYAGAVAVAGSETPRRRCYSIGPA